MGHFLILIFRIKRGMLFELMMEEGGGKRGRVMEGGGSEGGRGERGKESWKGEGRKGGSMERRVLFLCTHPSIDALSMDPIEEW